MCTNTPETNPYGMEEKQTENESVTKPTLFLLVHDLVHNSKKMCTKTAEKSNDKKFKLKNDITKRDGIKKVQNSAKYI